MRALLCIDIEPDARELPVPASDGFTGFDRILSDLGRLREILATTGTATINWFPRIDPQIEIAHGDATWVTKRYETEIADLLDAGDEIGVHVHNWRWDAETASWLLDHADAAWIRHCAGTGLDGYAAAFGRPCRFYRHGDRYMSADLAGVLTESPVEVDLTLEPGMRPARELVEGEPTRGVVPSVHPSLRRPLQPSPDALDLPSEPDGALTMVPLTSTLVPGWAGLETLVLWLEPAEFRRRLRSCLLDPELSHLAFAVRSDTGAHPSAWDCVLTNLRELSERVPGLEWSSASALAGAATRDGGFEGAGMFGEIAREIADLQEHFDTIGRPTAEVLRLERELEAATGAVHELSVERDDLRDHLERLGGQLDRVSWELEVMHESRWWRARQRLLPLLSPLARIQGRENPPERP